MSTRWTPLLLQISRGVASRLRRQRWPAAEKLRLRSLGLSMLSVMPCYYPVYQFADAPGIARIFLTGKKEEVLSRTARQPHGIRLGLPDDREDLQCGNNNGNDSNITKDNQQSILQLAPCRTGRPCLRARNPNKLTASNTKFGGRPPTSLEICAERTMRLSLGGTVGDHGLLASSCC